MSETLVTGVTRLVATMLLNGQNWTNELYLAHSEPFTPDDTWAVLPPIRDYYIGNISNNGFIEHITGYHVYQRHAGETNVEHPPIFQKDYHTAGNRNAAYGASTPHGDPLPKDVAIYVKLSTSGGRSGKQFLRCNLWEGEVISVEAGAWAFNEADDRFTTARFNTLVGTTLAQVMGGGTHVGDGQLVVPHLLFTQLGDTRTAFLTNVTGVHAIRPTWNKAHR